MPVLLAALTLAHAPQAHAIRGILSQAALLAEIGHPFEGRFIPVGSHLPKYPLQWSLNPADCLAASGIVLDANS
ncbi:MAG: hypothetical protein ACREX7_00790, partial [Casimicrobiaceae bacterium]